MPRHSSQRTEQEAGIRRLWSRSVAVDRGYASECWEWTGARAAGRHGCLKVKGVLVLCHRWAGALVDGPAPADKPYRLHRCNNGLCWRPDHTRWGTQSRNMREWWKARKATTLQQETQI